MKLRIERRWRKEKYTIGNLYINGVWECNTLEDADRLHRGEEKKKGETAIPAGTYAVRMDIKSPKYSKYKEYVDFCSARMPRLCGVPQFDGVLIHPGNTASDTEGCILVGKNDAVGKVTNSKATWKRLYVKMKAAHDRGESITIEIV